MSSDARVAASRANGHRSDGPHPGTHHLTRRNALRHGLAAESLMVLPHEDGEAYDALCEAVREDVAPGDMVEEQLALRLANLLWRLARTDSLEGGLFRRGALREERDRNEPDDPLFTIMLAGLRERAQAIVPREDSPDAREARLARRARLDAALAAVPMAETFVSDARVHGDSFTRLSRYERALQRSLDQTLAALDRRRLLRERRQPVVEVGED